MGLCRGTASTPGVLRETTGSGTTTLTIGDQHVPAQETRGPTSTDILYLVGYTKRMEPVQLIRAAAGMTQRQLADAAGISQPTVAAYESGTKSPTLAHRGTDSEFSRPRVLSRGSETVNTRSEKKPVSSCRHCERTE